MEWLFIKFTGKKYFLFHLTSIFFHHIIQNSTCGEQSPILGILEKSRVCTFVIIVSINIDDLAKIIGKCHFSLIETKPRSKFFHVVM